MKIRLPWLILVLASGQVFAFNSKNDYSLDMDVGIGAMARTSLSSEDRFHNAAIAINFNKGYELSIPLTRQIHEKNQTDELTVLRTGLNLKRYIGRRPHGVYFYASALYERISGPATLDSRFLGDKTDHRYTMGAGLGFKFYTSRRTARSIRFYCESNLGYHRVLSGDKHEFHTDNLDSFMLGGKEFLDFELLRIGVSM